MLMPFEGQRDEKKQEKHLSVNHYKHLDKREKNSKKAAPSELVAHQEI